MQNPGLWRKHMLRTKQIAEQSSTRNPNEKLLFHGAPRSVLSKIVNEGFDRRYSRNGAFGYGMYFAEASKYSHAFSFKAIDAFSVGANGNANAGIFSMERHQTLSMEGNFALLLCRVALGRQGMGAPFLQAPPPVCDSAGGFVGMQDPCLAVHAVYHNDQAYPEYVIYYKALV